MTLVSLPSGAFLKVPTAWRIWTWAGYRMKRTSDGGIWWLKRSGQWAKLDARDESA